jgi:hypothetical protein
MLSEPAAPRASARSVQMWIGDLNYRISMGLEEVHQHIASKNWAALLEKDQLRVEKAAGNAFKDWDEAPIAFAPTYKYTTGKRRAALRAPCC